MREVVGACTVVGGPPGVVGWGVGRTSAPLKLKMMGWGSVGLEFTRLFTDSTITARNQVAHPTSQPSCADCSRAGLAQRAAQQRVRTGDGNGVVCSTGRAQRRVVVA